MQKLIEKALELNANRRQAEKMREQARLTKEYEDARIMLVTVLGDDANPILDDAVPYYTGNEDGENRQVYLRNGDWLFDDNGHWDNKPRCRLAHVENRKETWTSGWDDFSDLATFGAAVRKQLRTIERRAEMEQRQAERDEQLKQQSPHRHTVSVFKQLIFDIEGNAKLSEQQRLVVAFVELFQASESIEEYDVQDDLDDDQDDDE